MEEKLAALEAREKRLIMHRNICVLADCMILYYTYKLVTEGAGAGFFVAMGAMVLVCAFLTLRAHKEVLAAQKEVADCKKEEDADI